MADSILNKTMLQFYKGLIKVNDDTNGVNSDDEQVVDGNGGSSTLYLSTTKTSVKPASNNQNSFSVTKSNGDNCLRVDTEHNRIVHGANNTYVNSNSFTFSGSNIDPTGAGYHMMIPCGGTYLGGATDEIDLGNGTDPATTLDISGLSEDTDVIHYYWYLTHSIEVTSMECFFGSESGTPSCNFHLFNYTLDKSNGGGSGDLSSGAVVAHTTAQSTSASAINYLNASVVTQTCNAGTVLVATIESNADVLLHAKACVKYYIV